MIAEIKFKNLYSFRDEAVFSFEADKSKEMESYHVVEVIPGVRLLKFAIIYGANASGKSNVIKVCDFIKRFVTHKPVDKNENTGAIPFLLNKNSKDESSDISITFYVCKPNELPVKYIYTLSLNRAYVHKESLTYYSSQQPTNVFERSIENNVSTIKFGSKIKLSSVAKEEISLKCLPNMSVLSAYMQVNVNVPEIEDVLLYFRERIMDTIASFTEVKAIETPGRLKEKREREYILKYLQQADFNISDIYSKGDPERYYSSEIIFKHKVNNKNGSDSYFEFPEKFESAGTLRTMDLAGYINELINQNAFLTIDEIEFSLHPKLIGYIIERFLKESDKAQLVVTTHYDGLLGEDDLLRHDNIWFTEKSSDGATILYPLTDFKGLNRISSLQKAYKFGKFGAVPNI